MTLSAEITELDLFRRTAETIRGLRRPVRPEVRPPQPIDWSLPGVVAKACVATAFGDLPIELLRPRDDVRTHSGATARIVAIDRLHLDQDFLSRSPRALPVRIPANSIGPGRPSNDLFVSPGQEISLDFHVATAFNGARSLSNRFRMDLSYATGLSYYRFHCGAPLS
jgi:Hint domain